MSNNLTSILRKVFLSSIAGIVATNSNISEAKGLEISFSEKEAESRETSFIEKKKLDKKLILKLNSNSEWEFKSHRSHRSHSSHRSHYSSQGGHHSHFSHYSSSSGSSGGSGSNSYSGSYSNPSSSYSNSRSSGLYTAPTRKKVLKLGDRTLKRNMSGRDVTELVNILLKKGYLSMHDGSMSVSGIYTYDDIVEDAIKQFQFDNNLDSDGIVGPTTIFYLKN
jgi:murein L,D-transpeptidase YcbB/YkuD